MDIKSYPKGAVIFKQGDPGDCMYQVTYGRVGVYDDYDGPNEKKLADLYSDQLFGEMGLLDHAPRTATVVSLDRDTQIMKITEEEFGSYFEKNPGMILELMQQMCNRLRQTSKDYVEVCHTVYEAENAEKSGTPISGGLKASIQKFAAQYKGFNFFSHT